jgi:hypothetical protein
MSDIAEMWAALEAHQSRADERGYGREWRRMCQERTPEAAMEAGEEAWSAEAESAAAKAAWAAEAGIRAKAGAAWATVAIMYIAEAKELKNYEF